jgi:hypothetical protein
LYAVRKSLDGMHGTWTYPRIVPREPNRASPQEGRQSRRFRSHLPVKRGLPAKTKA